MPFNVLTVVPTIILPYLTNLTKEFSGAGLEDPNKYQYNL